MSLQNHPDLWRHLFPYPRMDDNKYTRGTTLIAGGEQMTGAARLAAKAARRVGAGILRIAAPESVRLVYMCDSPSNIIHPENDFPTLCVHEKTTAILVGPGLGKSQHTYEKVMCALNSGKPVVIDGDGLSVFEKRVIDLEKAISLHQRPVVLTPHEGEMLRLYPKYHPSCKAASANALAEKLNCVVVLKGPATCIAKRGEDVIISDQGHAQLATAGTGDVLAGTITGLIAQKMDARMAAAAATWINEYCSRSYRKHCLIAEDLSEMFPLCVEELFGN